MHVFGLDVAMDDLLRVDVFRGARHLQRRLELALQIASVAVLDGVAQILAAQEFHHHERAMLFVFAEIVNAEDVVVGDVAGHARLGQKASLGFGVLRSRLR